MQSNNPLHRCPDCLKYFPSVKKRNQHDATDHDVNFRCHTCGAIFISRETLNNHLNNHPHRLYPANAHRGGPLRSSTAVYSPPAVAGVPVGPPGTTVSLTSTMTAAFPSSHYPNGYPRSTTTGWSMLTEEAQYWMEESLDKERKAQGKGGKKRKGDSRDSGEENKNPTSKRFKGSTSGCNDTTTAIKEGKDDDDDEFANMDQYHSMLREVGVI